MKIFYPLIITLLMSLPAENRWYKIYTVSYLMNHPIKNKVLRTIVSLLFVVHILIVIKLVLLKDPGDLKSHFVTEYNLDLFKKNIGRGNYVPLYTAQYYLLSTDTLRYSKENLVGNVLLFIPFGILLPLLFRDVRGFTKILSISLIISFALEAIQLFTILGNFDVDDIILNVLGAALGFGTIILANELIFWQKIYKRKTTGSHV